MKYYFIETLSFQKETSHYIAYLSETPSTWSCIWSKTPSYIFMSMLMDKRMHLWTAFPTNLKTTFMTVFKLLAVCFILPKSVQTFVWQCSWTNVWSCRWALKGLHQSLMDIRSYLKKGGGKIKVINRSQSKVFF